jgi:hypothetical protein
MNPLSPSLNCGIGTCNGSELPDGAAFSIVSLLRDPGKRKSQSHII